MARRKKIKCPKCGAKSNDIGKACAISMVAWFRVDRYGIPYYMDTGWMEPKDCDDFCEINEYYCFKCRNKFQWSG